MCLKINIHYIRIPEKSRVNEISQIFEKHGIKKAYMNGSEIEFNNQIISIYPKNEKVAYEISAGGLYKFDIKTKEITKLK